MNTKSFSAKEIIEKFRDDIIITIGNDNVVFTSFYNSSNPTNDSISWVNGARMSIFLLDPNHANFIITDKYFKELNQKIPENTFVVIAQKPKLLFIKILTHCFQPKIYWSKHPSAIISPDAKIHKEVYIGPNCVIGKVNIGKGCVLEGNNFIYDNVTLKENVIIQAGAIIGSRGMSMARDINDILHNFPSLGEIIIESDVEIGSNAVIDAAVMGKTFVGKGTKINSLTFIGNSAEIGEHNYISVCVNINGSVKIGNRNFIGSGSSIRNKTIIRNDNTVASGAIVIKNIDNNTTVMGNPAKEKAQAKNLHL
jgi:UDP-3-O-[3-hydroxymyristoyl] glucosamine N-acyltransferase